MEQDTATSLVVVKKKPLARWTNIEVQQWFMQKHGKEVAQLFHEDGAALADLTKDTLWKRLHPLAEVLGWGIRYVVDALFRDIGNLKSQQGMKYNFALYAY